MLVKDLERKLTQLEKRVGFLENIIFSKKIEIPKIEDLYAEQKQKINELFEFVAISYGMSVTEMLKGDRREKNVDARNTCIYILKQYFGLSDPDVACHIKKDRSTVIYSYQKVNELFYTNKKYSVRDLRCEKIINTINQYLVTTDLKK